MGAVLGAKFGTVLGDRISAGSSSENDLEVDGVFQLFLMQGALHNTITYFMLCSRVKKKNKRQKDKQESQPAHEHLHQKGCSLTQTAFIIQCA